MITWRMILQIVKHLDSACINGKGIIFLEIEVQEHDIGKMEILLLIVLNFYCLMVSQLRED